MDVDSSTPEASVGDDYVVKELDVYLCKNLMNNLYMLQYPVRQNKLPYDGATYNASRIKPKNKKVELEILLNTKDANYSTAKGEQFALNVDNNNPQTQRYYNSDVMDKQVLVSSNAAIGNMNKHYAIGVFKEDQLHLTPLQNLLQMRPSFEYFDIYEKKIKDTKDQMDTDHSTEDEDTDAEKTELITVRYTRDTAKQATQEVEQNWVKTEYINAKSDPRVAESHRQLYCSDETVSVDVDSLNADYSNLLLTLNTNETEAKHL